MKYLLILSFVLSVQNSWPDDDCVAGEAKADFSAKMSGLKNYKFNKSKSKEVTESFDLMDGTHVTALQGGCAHFGRSIIFTLNDPTLKDEPKAWIEKALAMLEKLPKPNNISKTLALELKEQEATLLKSKPQMTNEGRTIEATDKDGYDTVGLSLTPKGKQSEFKVWVSTAL